MQIANFNLTKKSQKIAKCCQIDLFRIEKNKPGPISSTKCINWRFLNWILFGNDQSSLFVFFFHVRVSWIYWEKSWRKIQLHVCMCIISQNFLKREARAQRWWWYTNHCDQRGEKKWFHEIFLDLFILFLFFGTYFREFTK